MKLSTAKSIVKAAVKDQIELGFSGLNERSIPMLVSDPGVGKTAIIREVTEELSADYDDWYKDEYGHTAYLLDGATRDPLDLGGYPKEVDGVMQRVPPHWTKFTGHGLYFLDEFSQAPGSTQNVFGNILSEHRVSEHPLPLGWGVVGATNKPSNRAGTAPMPTHIRTRVQRLEIEADPFEWIEYANREGFHPFVTSYIRAKPTALNAFDPDAEKCPTSRGWQKVSAILNRWNLGAVEEREAIMGEIGPASHEFQAFTKLFDKVPDFRAIFSDPEHAPLPEQGDVMWLLCGILAANADRSNIAALLEYLKRFERAEFAVATFKDVSHRLNKSKDGEPSAWDKIKTLKEVRDFRVDYLRDHMV